MLYFILIKCEVPILHEASIAHCFVKSWEALGSKFMYHMTLKASTFIVPVTSSAKHQISKTH